MKKQTKQPQLECAVQQTEQIAVTDTTRSDIGQTISFYLDLMNDPRFKQCEFRKIDERNIQSYELHVANSEMTIHFSIDWKGGRL